MYKMWKFLRKSLKTGIAIAIVAIVLLSVLFHLHLLPEEVYEAHDMHVATQRPDLQLAELTCQAFKEKNSKFVVSSVVSSDMTPKVCMAFCLEAEVEYMALTNGNNCLCSNQYGMKLVEAPSRCDMPCAGDSLLYCGGKESAIFYRIDERDGDGSWTTWMSFTPRDTASTYTSRYRDCDREDGFTSCRATVQSRDTSTAGHLISQYYIGCFTPASFKPGAMSISHFIKRISKEATSPEKCIRYCSILSAMYAVLTPWKTCLCTSALGWSQPCNLCNHGVGVVVFSASKIKDNRVTLKFLRRQTHKKLAVVSHYRGGSTITAALFNLLPGSLSVYEPGSLLGTVWPDVSSFGKEKERNTEFLQKIYPYWFDCLSENIPAVFYFTYPSWGEKFNIGLDGLADCRRATGTYNAALYCPPVLKELCLMSSMVIAKTTRILHAGSVKNFMSSRPDITVLHAIRDPRAMLASRSKLNSWFRQDQQSKLADTCWELSELWNVFEGHDHPSNAVVIHYEEIATDIILSATKLYDKMNITLPSSLKQQLLNLTAREGTRGNRFDIIQNNPKSRINHWIKDLSRDVVKQADGTKECTNFFNLYGQYYHPVDELDSPGS